MTQPRRLRIAFLTATDPLDQRSWSGLHYKLGQTLEKHVGDVTYLGPVSLRYLFALGDRINKVVAWLTGGKRYHYSISILVSRLYGLIFGAKLQGKHFDLLFAPAAYTEFAYLYTRIPIVYCADSTLTQLIDYYEGLSNLLPLSKRELRHIEQRAIRKASLLVYSSQWAAESARRDFGAKRWQVVVQPFGANFEQLPSQEQVFSRHQKPGCHLLFVGVEWNRKGGRIAVDTLHALRKMGVDAHLTVCGCVPPPGTDQSHLTVFPFLDKNIPEQAQQLAQLYLQADFFLLPTRAECAAIAFCEASAFGLPSFTTDTGGVGEFVLEGVNGFRLSLAAEGADYAAAIKRVVDDAALYAQLRRTARQLFEQRLNWDAWGLAMKRVLTSRFLAAPASARFKRLVAARLARKYSFRLSELAE
ncbi:glycosyltransferase family 4 protein [Hymenobacter metallilatus]|uniref:Glycosyltransferase n=1 Tax=Hymenobacter metallilatus TaxID=2493666 RepID=A0A3R9NIW4_9BACT|nr:glycosyltransferase family 4 protein [Hymenobacter metallilatus]RSK34014.1 glycosyltransferase [Hymenobacter metallilatus]